MTDMNPFIHCLCLFILIFCPAFHPFIQADSVSDRYIEIIGGSNAALGEFPFMVGVVSDADGLFCGGSLISDRAVLTAAHCFDTYARVTEAV